MVRISPAIAVLPADSPGAARKLSVEQSFRAFPASYFNRSHPRTYTIATVKNMAVAATKIRSIIVLLLLLELHQQRHIDAVLNLAQIRCESRHKCPRRSANIPDHWSGGARGRHAARPSEIRHVRLTMVVLPTERNVLHGHIVKRRRS